MPAEIPTTVPAVINKEITPISRDVIKLIADDIAKEVASHIEIMYPDAVSATSQSMLRSVRGCVFNEIMASLELTDEDAILARLDRNKKHRREMRATYRHARTVKDRAMPTEPTSSTEAVRATHSRESDAASNVTGPTSVDKCPVSGCWASRGMAYAGMLPCRRGWAGSPESAEANFRHCILRKP